MNIGPRDEPMLSEQAWKDEHRRLLEALPEPEDPGWAAAVLRLPAGHSPWGSERDIIRAIAALDQRLHELEHQPRVGPIEIERNP